jgi:hypothetical protein
MMVSDQFCPSKHLKPMRCLKNMYIVFNSWLVVSKMFYFPFHICDYVMSSQPHWRTPSFFFQLVSYCTTRSKIVTGTHGMDAVRSGLCQVRSERRTWLSSCPTTWELFLWTRQKSCSWIDARNHMFGFIPIIINDPLYIYINYMWMTCKDNVAAMWRHWNDDE